MIEKDDVDFKAYQIPIKQLSDLLEIPRNDFYRQVKAITKKLISNVLIFRENIDDDDELQVAWLTSAEYIKTKGI